MCVSEHGYKSGLCCYSGCVLHSEHVSPACSSTLADFPFHLVILPLPHQSHWSTQLWLDSYLAFAGVQLGFSHEATIIQVALRVPIPLAVRNDLFSCDFLTQLLELCLHSSWHYCISIKIFCIFALMCKYVCDANSVLLPFQIMDKLASLFKLQLCCLHNSPKKIGPSIFSDGLNILLKILFNTII